MLIAAATNSEALWYLTRGTGLVALVLLSTSVALGVAETIRWTRPAWPRFVTAALHKNISLLATAFLAVHIVTTVVDAFAPIRWLDVVVPFMSKYRPVWLGLGAVAVDLLIAVTITSLLRRRIGYRLWKAVHWAAYACWPVAIVHGLGTGSDSRHGWALAVYAASLAVVAGSVWWRLSRSWISPAPTARLVAAAVSVAVPVLIVGFFVVGPLRPGWAVRAGTPKSLIASARSGSVTVPLPAANPGAFALPFTDDMEGAIAQSNPDSAGLSTVTIDATLTGPARGVLHLVLTGASDAGGGISMSSSSASMGPASDPRLYQGQVTSLAGSALQLALRTTTGASATVAVRLRSNQGGTVTGVVQASG